MREGLYWAEKIENAEQFRMEEGWGVGARLHSDWSDAKIGGTWDGQSTRETAHVVSTGTVVH